MIKCIPFIHDVRLFIDQVIVKLIISLKLIVPVIFDLSVSLLTHSCFHDTALRLELIADA